MAIYISHGGIDHPIEEAGMCLVCLRAKEEFDRAFNHDEYAEENEEEEGGRMRPMQAPEAREVREV